MYRTVESITIDPPFMKLGSNIYYISRDGEGGGKGERRGFLIKWRRGRAVSDVFSLVSGAVVLYGCFNMVSSGIRESSPCPCQRQEPASLTVHSTLTVAVFKFSSRLQSILSTPGGWAQQIHILP